MMTSQTDNLASRSSRVPGEKGDPVGVGVAQVAMAAPMEVHFELATLDGHSAVYGTVAAVESDLGLDMAIASRSAWMLGWV
jgi:hypothetical protein